ncbi:hypothetical protein VVD49_15160 [Uliginosibacterium sp. H3]|uniref:Polymer-forming cytoskeletal protein n=1 Tax=Uliginosibacterium silvisoli TaxID=3114758 RepID=A0ABU6K649_9RHOO|nr:hypothetical protein [Uliginosibacterium sp. H3]
MSTLSLGTGLFLSIASCALLAPLWPALRQWRSPPPPAMALGNGLRSEWDAAARLAQTHVSENFEKLLELSSRDGVIRGAHADGTAFMVLGIKDYLSEQLPPSARHLRMQVIAARHLDIPGELVCDRLIFARGKLNIAHNAVLKTALSQRDVAIGTRARIRNWVHAEGRVDAAEGALLAGCASAGSEINLARRARFEQLTAPVIRFGRSEPLRAPATPVQLLPMQPPGNAFIPGDGRWIIDGDMSIPPGHSVNARLVVSGSLLVGTGSRLRGDLHVMGDLVIHHDATLNGAVRCNGDMRTGECCRLAGPILVTGQLTAGSQTVFGAADQLSTVVASDIRLQEGCLAHGAVWAQHRGEVLADSAQNSGPQAGSGGTA